MSLLAGCAKRSAMESSSPGAMDLDAGDDLSQLEQQLARREAQLDAAGFRAPVTAESTAAGMSSAEPARDGGDRMREAQDAPPSSAPAPEARADKQAKAEDGLQSGGRCEQVCEISAAICALEDRICGLVPRHPGEPRYEAACSRAAEDCRFATEACHGCA